jgi:large subunit ribosomal protein L3
MSLGLIGKKIGMSRVFFDDGKIVPVTIIKIDDNLKITQIKIKDTNDIYNAIQITSGTKKIKNVSKPLRGHYNKAKVQPGIGLWEFRTNKEEVNNRKLGEIVSIDIFNKGQKLDIKGISKGKGFSGVIKRHNFNSQRATHGNSLSHNAPGSIGQCQTPGRVFKGKKMAGRMGNKNTTIKNLEVININKEKNLLLIKGSVPGYNGRIVILNVSSKK